VTLGGCDRQKASERQAAPGGASLGAEQGPKKGLDRSHAGQPMPDIVIKDGDNEDVALFEFKGSPVLVNLWASWCVPCVKELPTLDALAAKKGPVEIVALSQDIAPLNSVKAFLAEHGIKTLDVYQDAAMAMAMSDKAGAPILPTSILYDNEGRELWRFVGDRDWTSVEAANDLAAAK
jgi:thiol-disulfide isomerase/thioredoxin